MLRNYNFDYHFANQSIASLLNEFHVGKERRKNLIMTINGIPVANNTIICETDVFSIDDPTDHVQFKPWKKKLDILFENEYVLVVDKPAGILVHPDGVNNNKTLANMVANYYLETNQDISVKVIHRIDTDTSGIVIFPKDIFTQCYLSYQIDQNILHREYEFVCSGKLKEPDGTLDFRISENRHIANKKRISKTGKVAITDYHLIEKLKNNLNYVSAKLRTGRTHQIRLHFSHIGCPLVGDALYNGNTNLLPRQALHSKKVVMKMPFTNEEITVISPLPEDIQNLINKYQK